MAVTIYHNPRCSKSRQTLQLIQDAGVQPRIVSYLTDPPDAAVLLDLSQKLGMPLSGLLRRGESEFKESKDLPPLDDDAALAQWITQHPKTLERPIVVDEDSGRAVVGRPPENVLTLLS
ncbi:MAG TPA: arsenate reductase (glutaredoxin) [Woeseiaceae bacterium]|nr:arsenate reductase (glutaredoxin) [Woeseiaceae bacterium]